MFSEQMNCQENYSCPVSTSVMSGENKPSREMMNEGLTRRGRERRRWSDKVMSNLIRSNSRFNANYKNLPLTWRSSAGWLVIKFITVTHDHRHRLFSAEFWTNGCFLVVFWMSDHPSAASADFSTSHSLTGQVGTCIRCHYSLQRSSRGGQNRNEWRGGFTLIQEAEALITAN